MCSEKAALAAVEAVLGPQGYRDTMTAVEVAKKAAEARTGWRIDGTLREFPKFPPVNLWFDFPVHRGDESGVLADIDPEGNVPIWQRVKKIERNRQRRSGRLSRTSTTLLLRVSAFLTMIFTLL